MLASISGLHNLREMALQEGDIERAAHLKGRSRVIYEKIGDRLGTAVSLHSLGSIAARRGYASKGLELLKQALEIDRTIGNRQGQAQIGGEIGLLYLSMDEIDSAMCVLREALEINLTIGYPSEVARVLFFCALAQHRRGGSASAARTASAARAIPNSRLMEAYPGDEKRYHDLMAEATEILGEQAMQRCREAGAMISMDCITRAVLAYLAGA